MAEFTLFSNSTDDEIIEAARREGVATPDGARRVSLLAFSPGGYDTADVYFSTTGHRVRRFVEFPNLVCAESTQGGTG